MSIRIWPCKKIPIKKPICPCKEILYSYSYYYGPDWEILHGVNSGVTQISQNVGVDQGAVWNFPIEVTFQLFGIYGWPRLVLCASMFAPSESSLLRQFTTWITGSRPEFYHSTFVAQGKDRALTLVRSSGYVNVILNVVVKGIEP
jgi:B9 domain-containing protein 1